MATKRSLGLIRDAGLRRIRTVTGWTAAGALAGTGIFVGLAAHSPHVSTSAATKTNATGVTSAHHSSATRSHGDDGGGDDNAGNDNAGNDNAGNDNGGGGGQVSFPTQLAPNPAPSVQPASSGGNSPLVSGAS